MKKVISIVLLFVLAVHLQTVSAGTFSSYLPGGKNYLDPDNLELSNGVLRTKVSFKVKSNQIYTLSFPGRDMLGENISVLLEGDEIYIEEFPISNVCVEENNYVSCTFTTSTMEDELYISISSEMMGLYHTHHGADGFQLEEGDTRTVFEPYIAPFVDSESPEFQGSGAYITSCDTVVLMDEIVGIHIIAHDEIDGDLTNQIQIVSDEYTGNESQVGEYLVELSVSDSNGNTSFFNLFVMVKDEKAPIITGPTNISTSYTEKLTIDSIKALFSVDDNHDIMTNSDILVVSDTYSESSETPGEYIIEFHATDSSGNTSYHQITVTVIDDIAPIIYIDQYIVVIDTGSTFGFGDMMKLMNLSENLDERAYDITVIQDEYTGNEDKSGDYIYKVKLTDENGAEFIREFQIKVKEEVKIVNNKTQIIYSVIGVLLIGGALVYKKTKKKLVR